MALMCDTKSAIVPKWVPSQVPQAHELRVVVAQYYKGLYGDFSDRYLACVQMSPLPRKKIGRRNVVSSPDFFLRERGRLYTGYLYLEVKNSNKNSSELLTHLWCFLSSFGRFIGRFQRVFIVLPLFVIYTTYIRTTAYVRYI